MKTEQELKDELEDIFFDALTDKSNPPYYTDKVDPENDGYWQYKVYELCADELIKRGYGDVSEYKAEIEQLKSKCEEQDNEIDRLECVIKENDERCFDCPQVKRVQIDILNEVKRRLDRAPNGWAYTTYIDELIEEVQNDTK